MRFFENIDQINILTHYYYSEFNVQAMIMYFDFSIKLELIGYIQAILFREKPNYNSTPADKIHTIANTLQVLHRTYQKN